MGTTEDLDTRDGEKLSHSAALQQISEEAFRAAGQVLNNIYAGSSNVPPVAPVVPPGHRRCQSELSTKRSNSFQRWKAQMQKAWRWGNDTPEKISRSIFNPEVLASQKRQWYQLHTKILDHKKYKEPTSLFEHFLIVGLHSDANLDAVEDAFAKRKIWESEMAKSDLKKLQYRGPSIPTFEPQILFQYPHGRKFAVQPKDLLAFCFPGGVKARLMERTPSMSDLNEIVYGQEHLSRDDLAFIFSLKVADNATLYGVCLHVQEIVQRPPSILSGASSLSQSSGGCSRFLVSAPRCYCVLTKVPFFELHYEMLNSIIAQERLDRITQFVSEMTLTECVSPVVKTQDRMNGSIYSPHKNYTSDWMASAIPVDSAVALSAVAAGLISDEEIPSLSLRSWEPQSPESFSTSEASDFGQVREIDKDTRKNVQYFDDSSETSESHSDSLERMSGSYENGQSSPEIWTLPTSRSLVLERLGSSESLLSSVRSMRFEDEDDENVGDDVIMEWAKVHKNELLQIVCGYHALPLPARGSEIIFQPLEHLQAIKYNRPAISALDFSGNYPDMKLQGSLQAAEFNARLAAAEEAFALSIWTTATVCRVLSLESVLALLSGVLLEKQVVVVCPNLGVLSATVLSLIPMIRPFEWQSLLLPVLPRKMLEFLDAPVPFIVGIQHKPAELKMKTSNLVHVNIFKDQVKMCYLPPLPRHRELVSELGPIHARLSCENSIAKRHPVYKCNEVQAEAAAKFLNVMRHYFDSLCSDLRSHTITCVESNNDKVSLLLKDSFIDSFPPRDQPFIKHFVDTQLFSVLSDSRLSRYEHE
ncbi:uncharacterized protein LOC122084685 isoform X2 [Macadamia integrifolia]|uniref:uncharacterized protein LOC122084685 isoform X2 n=1 Tax=Macadamia integrifolia TaxID=60698 RepID=UPI001C4E7DA6|nr:uncharacterized protein LOC122084685 isoform X2 [Macadamia integrifolia]